MQNPIQKFRQSSFRELPYSSIFFAETLYTFPAYQCLQKGVRNFFILSNS